MAVTRDFTAQFRYAIEVIEFSRVPLSAANSTTRESFLRVETYWYFDRIEVERSHVNMSQARFYAHTFLESLCFWRSFKNQLYGSCMVILL